MVAIITGGVSGMGDEFTAHGARAIVIADVQDEKGHRHLHDVIIIALRSHLSLSLSLSLFWWLVVLIVVGWLRFVDRR